MCPCTQQQQKNTQKNKHWRRGVIAKSLWSMGFMVDKWILFGGSVIGILRIMASHLNLLHEMQLYNSDEH